MPTRDPHNPNDPTRSGAPEQAPSHQSDDFMSHPGGDPASRRAGYELADANVKDIAIFLVVLGSAVAIVFVLALGIGKLIYMELGREDGATSKWSQTVGAKRGNLESNPEIQQQQLQQIVKRFPAPRLQTDDGNVDVAHMHAREDMMLDYYSWADQQNQTVRIPIARAMQLLAERGLPVEAAQQSTKGQQSAQGQTSAKQRGTKKQQSSQPQNASEAGGSQPGTSQQQPMFGDGSNAVTAPLTDGFARTGPELEMLEARQQAMANGVEPKTQAELHPAH